MSGFVVTAQGLLQHQRKLLLPLLLCTAVIAPQLGLLKVQQLLRWPEL
jgi:hypothetical protein